MGHLKLTKVQILSHKNSVRDLLEDVQKYGSFHAINVDEPYEGTNRHNTEELLSSKNKQHDVEKALNLLEPYRVKGNFLDEMLPVKNELSQEQATKLIENAKPDLVIDRIIKLDETIKKHEKEISTIEGQISSLQLWENFPLTRRAFSNARKVRIETGNVPYQNINALMETLSNAGDRWELELVPISTVTNEQQPVLFFCLSSEASTYIPILNEAGFQEYRLPERFTPEKEILRCEENVSKLKAEIKHCISTMVTKAKYVKVLRLTLDNIKSLIARLEKENEALCTRTTVVIEGWLPEKDFPELKHKFEKSGTVHIEKIEKLKDEEEPVELINNSFSSPFEVITSLYSMPKNTEYDPTPFLAPFFAIFIGLCLTDAAYGLIILIGCLALLKRLNPSGAARKLLITLSICGVSTIIIGGLAGGFMGITSSDPE